METITKKQFIENFKIETMCNHLRVTFVTFNGVKIGYKYDGKVVPMPTSKTALGLLFKFFTPEVKAVAYPKFNKTHTGSPVTVVSTLVFRSLGTRQWFFDEKRGYTELGNESNSYIISKTYPTCCNSVSIFDL